MLTKLNFGNVLTRDRNHTDMIISDQKSKRQKYIASNRKKQTVTGIYKN
jgi:hypothetical protein